MQVQKAAGNQEMQALRVGWRQEEEGRQNSLNGLSDKMLLI